jgi:hypothetical protein
MNNNKKEDKIWLQPVETRKDAPGEVKVFSTQEV